MTMRIVIQHLGGSKANQIEQFPTDSANELTIGREPGSSIQFDATRDDAVSRKHASILVTPGDPPTFKLVDHGSRNGTLLNGKKLEGESELMLGDVVQLGTRGAKFTFDLDPRPANLTARTRLIETGALGATRAFDTATTRAFDPSTRAETVPMTAEQRAQKTGVGRDTVMHMLSEQRHATSRTAIYVIAALLVTIGAVGGVVYYRNHLAVLEQNAKLAEQQKQLEQEAQAAKADTTKAEEASAALRRQVGVSPEAIMEKYGNTTVVVKVRWNAYDKETGKLLFHKTICPLKMGNCNKNDLLPAYVHWGTQYYRWLTTDDEDHTNYPIGGTVQGSGFLIDSQGFIITNRHVAVSWKRDYSATSGYDEGHGVMFEIQDHRERNYRIANHMQVFDVHQWENAFRSLISWTPSAGGPIFANDQPLIIGRGENTFEGKNESVTVRFPGAHADVEARLVRNSDDADLALLKIDATTTLLYAPMADKEDNIKVGEPVSVLGYPNYASRQRLRETSEEVPEPTITNGSISKQRIKPDEVTDGNYMYQMTVTVGHGSSGGPVFNGDGKVIGVLTAMSSLTAGVSYAIPISYAHVLVDLQRSN